jgi:rSAM/selenodomain-associated transferase 1
VTKGKALILFSKYPEKGAVKTRLAKDLGDIFTLELYKCFLADILENSKRVDAEIFIITTPPDNKKSGNYCWGEGYICLTQEGSDIGSRMYNAFCEVCGQGYRKIVLIGGDIPELYSAYIDEAFQRLDEYDMVIGPCVDGGYYLIALRNDNIDYKIFSGISWSTSLVLGQTFYNARQINMTCYFLPKLRDIDTADDLKHFYTRRHKMKKGATSHTMTFLSRREDVFL